MNHARKLLAHGKRMEKLGVDSHVELVLGVVYAFSLYLEETKRPFSYEEFESHLLKINETRKTV